MKKFILLLFTVVFTACSVRPQQPVQNNKEYTLLTSYNTDYAFTDKGVYETIDHMDGTSDVLFTDIATGTRQLLGEMTVETAPSCGNNSIFFLNDCVYFVTFGDGVQSPLERDNTTLYKYTADGKLTAKHSFDKNFRPLAHPIVHDGKDLYFIAGLYTSNDDKTSEDLALYRMNADTFETERLCDANFTILGAYKSRLIVGVSEYNNGEYTRYIESVDMTTYEQTHLFETERILWSVIDGKMYNYMETPGSLKVYDIETGDFSEIKLFDYDPADVKNYRVEYYPGDRYIHFTVCRTEQYIYSHYVYDLNTGNIQPSGMDLYIFGKAGDYYLVPLGEKVISLGNGGYETIDNDFAFISQDDYISGNKNFISVTSNIDYR